MMSQRRYHEVRYFDVSEEMSWGEISPCDVLEDESWGEISRESDRLHCWVTIEIIQ